MAPFVNCHERPWLEAKSGTAGLRRARYVDPSGPYANSDGYFTTLSDASVVTGAQILTDIHDWLAVGAPDLAADV
jgi:hypothetical protein